MPENYNSSGGDTNEKKEIRTRRAVIFIFTVLGVFLLFFSLRNLNNKIYSPFGFTNESKTSLEDSDNEFLSNYLLQTSDTDGDGLSDYDEIYIYGTSAYLADTDSDGISDYDEIMRGSDPLCPEGQDCYGLNDPASLGNVNTLNATSSEEEIAGEDLAVLEEIISGQADPNFLRNLLLENGFSEEELSGISDEELQMAYFEVVSDQLGEVTEGE